MSIRWSRHLPLFFTAGLALAAFGCGDDDGGGDRPDARPQADAEPGNPDAGGDGLLRSGTIAVTEQAITNDIPGSPWSGAVVSVGFSDATTGSAPAPVDGFDSNINNCLIRIWNVDTNEDSDAVDEGAVQVTGTDNGDFACGFNAGLGGYACQSTTPAIAGGVAGNGENFVLTGATDTLTMPGVETSQTMVGMYIVLNGFAPVPDGTRLPILAVNEETDTITSIGINDALTVTGDANASFSTFVGVAPVPAGGAQFLGGAADAITVQKAAGDVVAAIDEDFEAHGQGFTLLEDEGMRQYLPSTIPFDEEEVNFACDGDGCGAEGTGGLIQAIVINGETTDAPVDAITSPADAMPAPETQYATFQCSFIGEDNAKLTADMMAAILGTNPTRIQTSVGRYRGAIIAADDGSSSTIVLQGHALLGWSDPPPK
jgi:hypothetical protein